MSRPPYPPEFRRQMVELVRAGRTPEELAGEFEATAQSIRNWVAQAGRDFLRAGDGSAVIPFLAFSPAVRKLLTPPTRSSH